MNIPAKTTSSIQMNRQLKSYFSPAITIKSSAMMWITIGPSLVRTDGDLFYQAMAIDHPRRKCITLRVYKSVGTNVYTLSMDTST